MSRQTANTLHRAKQHLIDYGWQKGGYGRRNWPCCASGAVWAVTYGRPQILAYAALLNVLRSDLYHEGDFQYGEFPVRTVAGYNDHPNRRYRDIIQLFERAIAQEGGIKPSAVPTDLDSSRASNPATNNPWGLYGGIFLG